MEGPMKFATGHMESIHDICYDFYGRRLATCSADRSIKVWDLNESGEWVESGGMSGNISNGHIGVVLKVDWAHPEFGTLLASCSEDHTVIVWKEEMCDGGDSRTWVRKADLVDARLGVSDLKFAPHHLGLKLAAGSKDGFVRIYEAADSMKPDHWSLVHEFEGGQRGLEVRCICWNPSRFDTPMIVVGCAKDNEHGDVVHTKSVLVWTYNEPYRKWLPLPILGDCPAGDVWSTCWAPNMGRSHHYIACCSRDVGQHLRLWEIPAGDDMFNPDDDGREVQPVFLVDEAGQTKDSSSQVRRVEWNLSGSTLATSGDDGEVSLWQCDYFSKKWVRVEHHSVSG
eukprot:TRINITY_DN4768_c0_g1_i1.p1 TRINITY_DN4768_c0_g1~~TRINITY_DN4768_c0_g1_i1.p1  ORF type:complete len:340 (-),score=73.18 TRINITY_DN4768_c0_g1_i1:398-1417(-)